jgi:hypothetical protein
MKVNPSKVFEMPTEFKPGVRVQKVASDYTNGRIGIVLDINVNEGKSKIYWYRSHITHWCPWCSLKLISHAESD